MYIEKIINGNKSKADIKYEFDSLTNEQVMVLLNEIKTQKDSLKESVIVNETKIKTLEERQNEILKELKEKYQINSLEEANVKMSELNDEIISALSKFSEEYSKA